MTDGPGLEWTGERLVPEFHGDTALEHLHRYAFAGEFARGKDVLDIACGEGYGTSLLAEVAAHVVGVDIAPDVVDHASRRYGRGDRVTFKVGTCTSIPLGDASVDLVVSFETLEHIAEHEQMLREVRRVLRPGGTLVISTPEKMGYTIQADQHNPFHVRELFRGEFEQLLGAFFGHVHLFEQRICHGSVLVPSGPTASFRHYLGDFQRTTHTDSLDFPVYNVAVASDSAEAPAPRVSLFQGLGIPTDVEKQLAQETVSAREGWACVRRHEEYEANLVAHYERTLEHERNLSACTQAQATLDRNRLQHEHAQQLHELRVRLHECEQRLAESERRQAEILHSRTWAMALRLKRMKALLTMPLRALKGQRVEG